MNNARFFAPCRARWRGRSGRPPYLGARRGLPARDMGSDSV